MPLLFGFVATAVASNCGGSAVVDGGVGGGSDSSDGGSTTSSFICDTPEPVGTLTDCGATIGSGAGLPSECEVAVCDAADNEWRSSCDDEGCVCYFNGSARCSCVVDQGGAICIGSTPSCCPDPFPAF